MVNLVCSLFSLGMFDGSCRKIWNIYGVYYSPALTVLIHEREANLWSLMQLIEYLKGLVCGVVFIFSIHAVNAFLGCASFSWPHILPSLDAMAWLKLYGQMGLLIAQGIVVASAISLVEELLFRSWLPQEIAVDLGYRNGIMISGLAFSFLQRFVFSLELCLAYFVHALHFGFFRTLNCIYYFSFPQEILLKSLILYFSSVFLFVLVRLFISIEKLIERQEVFKRVN